MDGCELHGESRDSVIARWGDPRIEAATAVTVCSCCWGPAIAEMVAVADEAGNDLPGGVSRPVLCSRCKVVTDEQWAGIIARLNEEVPVA